jgi:hypothetical protein
MDKVKWVTMFDYWVLGIPLSYYLMFSKNMALEGLWWGPTLACALNYLFYEIAIRSSDWQEIADKTLAKLTADKEHNAGAKGVDQEDDEKKGNTIN